MPSRSFRIAGSVAYAVLNEARFSGDSDIQIVEEPGDIRQDLSQLGTTIVAETVGLAVSVAVDDDGVAGDGSAGVVDPPGVGEALPAG
jgi:hypothetical protein